MENGIKELKEFLSEHRKIDIDFKFHGDKILLCFATKQLMIIRDDIIFFVILNNFYNQFTSSSLFGCFIDEAQKRIREIDPYNYTKPVLHNSVAKNIVAFYFLKFLKENEIELICEIEREKSNFYAKKYNDFSSIKKTTNNNLEYLLFVDDELLSDSSPFL